MDRGMPPNHSLPLTDASKRVAHRLLTILENRVELLTVELQEERQRISRACALAVAALIFSVLAGGTLTALIVVALWGSAPVITLAILTALYFFAAGFSFQQLARLQSKWKTLHETIEQFRKDCECLKENLH